MAVRASERLAATACSLMVLLGGAAYAESSTENAAVVDGKTLMASRCVGCHTLDNAGHWSRISNQRKTPEGWHMTLTRMQHDRGVVLTDAEKDATVKYLADTQGLAPGETAPYRYVLERRNNTIEQYNAINRPDPNGIAKRCTTCHSYARIALQRRSVEEWRLLLHFHVGQFPMIEFHPAARISAWWEENAPQLPRVLVELFPLSTPEWTEWRKRMSPDLSGDWRVVGHFPGVGFYSGTRTVKRAGPDAYETTTTWEFADGHNETRDGTAVVYTGYEWRGRTNVRREDIREIYTVSAAGDELTGRWFLARHSELGGEFTAVRIRPGESRLIAANPYGIQVGTTQRITLYGTNLSGVPQFGPDLAASIVSRTADRIVVDVAAAPSSKTGLRTITLGSAASHATLAVYKNVDQVRVTPEYAFCRLGEGGGKIPFVGAQFEAIAYASMPDGSGKEGASVPVGVLPATWTLEPHTPTAKEWDDQLFAGRIASSGLFVPAQGGINTLRTKGTPNNTGDLTVKATADVGGRTLEGTSHLVVSTGMLFFNVPIR
jgi:quinohemoprotein amine dehydrogenase